MAHRQEKSENGPEKRGPDNVRAMRRRTARRTASVLPTLFTLANVIAGFLSIFFASRMSPGGEGRWLTYAAAMVFVGMVMDGLDGSVARMTRSTSNLGAQLDSMADMLTFGAAPAFMAVQLVAVNAPFVGDTSKDMIFDRFALVVACIYVSCAALRLARFNADLHKPTEADHGSFKGLPSPGAAGTVASLVLLHQLHLAKYFKTHPPVEGVPFDTPTYLNITSIAMVLIMLLVAFAMVSRWRYVHLVNRYLRGRATITRIGKYVIVLLIMTIRYRESLAAVFVLYALSAPAMALYHSVTGRKSATEETGALMDSGVPAPSDLSNKRQAG